MQKTICRNPQLIHWHIATFTIFIGSRGIISDDEVMIMIIMKTMVMANGNDY